MAKKTINNKPIINPITINTLNIEDQEDLTYEIGLGKLIKAVVDGVISEDELNAVFKQVALEIVNIYFNSMAMAAVDCLKTMPCLCCETKKHGNVFSRAWSKVKGWFKK